jgi:hypothetical protein
LSAFKSAKEVFPLTFGEEQLPKLADIKAIYNMAAIDQKQALVKAVFNSELRYRDGVYQTPYLLELFQPKAALLKEKRLLEYEKSLAILGENSVCAPSGSVLEHFEEGFNSKIKRFLLIISEIM